MDLDFIGIIILLGIIQGVFLAFILLTASHGNRAANRVLALLMLLFALDMSHVLLVYTQSYLRLPHLLMLNHPQQFLYGPLLLWYVVMLTRPDISFKRVYLLNLLPFAISLIYFSVHFYFHSASYKIEHYTLWQYTVRPEDYFWSLAHILFSIAYLVLAIFNITRHRRRIQERFSYKQKINLLWLQRLLTAILFVFILSTIFDILYLLQHSIPGGGAALALIMAVIIYAIGYMGWQQPAIFGASGEPSFSSKYAGSPLNPSQSSAYRDKLQTYMDSQQPFLDSSLTIKDLASQLDIPAYQLSRVINEYFRQNFFDFINSYRIREAQRRLKNPKYKAYSILSIAYDVGFNSKSSFNTAFKKHTSMTPSQYRNRA